MQDERIRLTKTDSANSVNKDNFVDVELQRHTKVFPFLSVKETIDQRELFEQERANSTNYRLILTINPYCSNVLFNAVTEIVKNEGTNKVNDLYIAASDGVYNANGLIRLDKTNTDMVRNTSYSNDGYEYHCGFDIFNNHILRNQSFKLVNTSTSTNNKSYNTISDYMRYADGSIIDLVKRQIKDDGSIDYEIIKNKRHLYLKEDVLSFVDSINANLSEQNGWWGFYNRSTIASCKFNNSTKKWEDLNISKVFNGSHFNVNNEKEEQLACKFFEMYPDSTLYSFNPKYNRFQNREEQNWDICITYPYENDEDKNKLLINGSLQDTDNNGNAIYINALLLASYKQTKGTSGQDIILFRSYVKHNLHKGDKIKLYYSVNTNNMQGNFIEVNDREFEVVNIGDLENNNLDYYFYINDVNDLKQSLNVDVIEDNTYTFRFIRIVNNRNCKYYYRKFRKLPNFKFKKEELTEEIINNKTRFNEYINNNCKKDNTEEMLPFNKEQYPLAFSKTIYNDENTQVVFTDTIDIDKLVDNLGRPLTELYITIIKRNKGHNIWYKKKKTADDLKNIEFSHCFGKLTSGLEIHTEWSDDEFLRNTRKIINDCNLITTKGTYLDDDITIEDNIFYGDVVELDTYNMKETVLSDVHFRFNTEQREHTFTNDELNCGAFIYDEIESDDYDINGFKCGNYSIKNATYRPEGYHYKAHYPIKVREFGSLRQGSYEDIKVSSCNPKQANGMFIEVVSSIRSGVNSGDIVYLCDKNENLMIPLFVNSVQSNVRFLLNPMTYGSENYKTIFEIIEGILHSSEKIITQNDIDNGYMWVDKDGNRNVATGEIKDDNDVTIYEGDLNRKIYDYSKPKYTLRIKNKDIPSYAYKVGVNTYLWRDVLNVGDINATELTEYPFANGHFYINKNINFFLKRQDAFGYNELYDDLQTPNDIFGNTIKQSNYEYKDEENRIC